MAQKRANVVHPSDPPRKQVFLLTCMDLRLTDDTTHFMNEFNLVNRYDHLAIAGAAMGARRLKTPTVDGKVLFPWSLLFFHHLTAAIDTLHRDIKDIIILEHLDCGAYNELHPDLKLRKEYDKLCKTDMRQLTRFHRQEAQAFAKDILAFCAQKRTEAENAIKKIKKKIASQTASVDDYRDLIGWETNADSWSDIKVRCFQMNLQGRVDPL